MAAMVPTVLVDPVLMDFVVTSKVVVRVIIEEDSVG